MKLWSSSFGITSILVSMLSGMGISGVNESNIQYHVAPDCVSTSDFIENNFQAFVSSYNEGVEDRNLHLNATYVESKKSVTNIDDNSQAIYLDFNDDNGYALIGNNYLILDFATTGDLYYLKDVDNILFTQTDGFVYETEFGYARYDFEYPTEKDLANTKFNRAYNGQDSYGSGKITNPDSYIKDRYGSGFSSYEVKLKDYQNVVQNSYSIYWNRKTGFGEGNCTLSAMFGVMQYFRDHKSMKKLPTGEIKIIPENDYFYKSAIKDYYVHESIKENIPKIYAKIRENAIKFGYTTESTVISSLNMANIFTNTMRDFGYSTKTFQKYANMIIFWSFGWQVKAEIDAGYPTIWNTLGGQYGAHSLVVKGYRQFYRDRWFLFFKWREYKNLMIVNDNHKFTDSYFDLDAYGRNLFGGEGLGTFLKVRNYAY
ncbi:MAG: hypothetical protein K2F52_01195 [Malacoplasma sp.]|nr:hypothetical protein [Malacoplasma sp.]